MSIRNIVIVGGGAAGWLTAAHLSRVLDGGRAEGGARIVVIEAPEIGLIGVGEGSFPTLRATLSGLGLAERAFMRACSATFKQGVWFQDWAERGHAYFHPFNLPFQGEAGDLSAYWLARRAAGDPRAFADAVTAQQRVVEAGRGPKRLTDPDFGGPMNYAYHFDAVRFAGFLRDAAVADGVTHLQDTVLGVERDERGDISAVIARDHGRVEGDFFIDCSGFRALLLKDVDGPWRDCGEVLLNDRALAIQVPYATPDTPIAPYTRAVAQDAGWIWDIGLEGRRGVGYVYSSRHIDEGRAEAALRAYVGREHDATPARRLSFATGYRERQWIGNCVAVGLSAGFFEPLESTGIMLIEVAARMIGEAMPLADRASMAAAARSFNAAMTGRFERIADFLKLHYCITRRTDTAYWRDNADPATIPESLQDRLAQWRHRPISRFDFIVDLETFLPASWQYILYGMGFPASLESAAAARFLPAPRQAELAFAKVAAAGPEAVRHLPDQRELIARYHAA
jgi:tryptophan 7-halogenase